MKTKTSLITLLFFQTISVLFAQTKSPNVFLDIKLGMTLEEFKTKNPSTSKGEFWFLNSELRVDKNLETYQAIRQTINNENVTVIGGFIGNKLVLFQIRFRDGASNGVNIYKDLESTYGKPTKGNSINWKDMLNGKIRTTESYYWEGKYEIMNFLYVTQLANVSIVFADKAHQQKLN